MKKERVNIVILLWLIFVPILIFYYVFGDIVQSLFTNFYKDTCLIFLLIGFITLTIIVLLKQRK